MIVAAIVTTATDTSLQPTGGRHGSKLASFHKQFHWLVTQSDVYWKITDFPVWSWCLMLWGCKEHESSIIGPAISNGALCPFKMPFILCLYTQYILHSASLFLSIYLLNFSLDFECLLFTSLKILTLLLYFCFLSQVSNCARLPWQLRKCDKLLAGFLSINVKFLSSQKIAFSSLFPFLFFPSHSNLLPPSAHLSKPWKKKNTSAPLEWSSTTLHTPPSPKISNVNV